MNQEDTYGTGSLLVKAVNAFFDDEVAKIDYLWVILNPRTMFVIARNEEDSFGTGSLMLKMRHMHCL